MLEYTVETPVTGNELIWISNKNNQTKSKINEN